MKVCFYFVRVTQFQTLPWQRLLFHIMLHFDIITLFPSAFSYFDESIIKRAKEKELVKIKFHNLRDFTKDKHKKVDDRPYGGGAGMVLMAEPIISAVESAVKPFQKKGVKSKVIIFSAKGKPFNQKLARQWSKNFSHIVLVSGRYEGIDERAKKILKAEEVSIGPYVLTDGDIASMVVVSAVSRLIPGTIKFESLQEESHWDKVLKDEQKVDDEKTLEYPHYTRPEILEYKGKKYRAPKVLLSGNHIEIDKWRKQQMK